ncbi:chemosensory receptor a [Plakobranchus ocellatus]|uniref:Chemosensory receptor a n=1 Tax=Plakobranchus ocellatus TaxID=259542 RepID=A0AAV4E1M4_9GAST|nr:chemosensory receptor a [Plakobranchus ocellatus]
MNTTIITREELTLMYTIRPVLSAQTYFILANVLIYCVLLVALVGIVANTLVIITYIKVGLSETINISYLALGISDLSVSVLRFWTSMCFIFLLANVELPFEPTTVSVTTGFYPGQGFEKTTAFITAFIALERCLCVQFPLHVRTMVTRRKTIICILLIFTFVFAPSNLIHMVLPLKWVFNPAQNRSILAIVPLQTPLLYIVTRALLAYYGTILHFTALIAVWICTIFLALGLKRKAHIKRDNFKTSHAQQDKQKERRVIKTVVMLAVTYLACSTPIAATMLVPHFEPEFESTRGFARISTISHMISGLLAQVNSSANLFIYIYMGSKFRNTFLMLCGKRNPRDQSIANLP